MVKSSSIIFYQDGIFVPDKPVYHDIDVEKFEDIYREFMTYVFRYIYLRVKDRDLTEELTSQVFEKALTHFHTYKKEKAAPQTWLISIARNTVTDYYRKASSKGHVPLEAVSEMESTDPLPEDKTENREELERLRFCFGGLDQREQELISLKFAWELNNRNIAPLLSLSESNVGTILYRAILKLRKCIEDWINGIR
jgi:RNA polymerase sigma factor (sigma-70 family)